jgi:hypothetical protein
MTRLLTLALLTGALLAPPAGAATPIDLGPGATPDVAVDAAGTAHIVFQAGDQGPLPVDYCRLPPGATTCEVRARLPLAPTQGRPRIVVRADGLVIVAAARHVDESWATYVLTSADGGASWTPPVVTGTAWYDIDAIELTQDGQALDTLHVGSLTGHELQRVPLAAPPEARVVRLEGSQWAANPALAEVDGTTVYLRDSYGSRTIRQRTFAGGGLYAPASWPERRFGARRRESMPDTASGPRGTWLVTSGYRIPRRVQLRRLTAGGPGPARAITGPAGVRRLRMAQDGRGRLHVTWLAGSERGGVCRVTFRCLVGTRGTWKRVRGRSRLVFSREHVLARSRSRFAAPDAGLENAAGPGGAAAAVYVTNGGSVRVMRLAR